MSDPLHDLAASAPPSPKLTAKAAAIIWAVILAIDLGGLWFFESRGLANLYGDGIAHVEGARRFFDALTPGLAQIGSVWLPLTHFLAAPLAINNTLWRTGLAGSIVSAAAFALAAWFLVRLSLEMNGSVASACVTLAFFLISPNMLYAASTPLTEPLAVFWAVLVVYGLFRFQQSGAMMACVWTAIAAFAAALTRYDGWYALPFAALFILVCRRRSWRARVRQTVVFCLISGCAPLLWFIHNIYRYGNPLQFYNGPYSAKAIYAHQIATTGYRYPTDGSWWLAAHYYLEDIRLVFGPWTLALAALGFVAWILGRRLRSRRAASLLLLVPLLFYTQSLAYGSVPIYVPTLSPHTYYNLRYGLEMAPALAMFPGFLLAGGKFRNYVIAGALGVILFIQAAAMAFAGVRGVAVAEEAVLNTPCKTEAEQDVIRFFRKHYDGERVLLESEDWPCLMPQVGIPYKETLAPRDRKYWRQVRYGASRWAGWIVRKRGDAVDKLMLTYPDAFADFDLVRSEPLPNHEWLEIYRRRPRQDSTTHSSPLGGNKRL
ncbi:MAG: hypothetical protein KGM47_10630 [Acidobacteriota bacterium]|nr:hypothetical protein [Acidobacteriota bacterium]